MTIKDGNTGTNSAQILLKKDRAASGQRCSVLLNKKTGV